jgi:hypothetical protein
LLNLPFTPPYPHRIAVVEDMHPIVLCRLFVCVQQKQQKHVIVHGIPALRCPASQDVFYDLDVLAAVESGLNEIARREPLRASYRFEDILREASPTMTVD